MMLFDLEFEKAASRHSLQTACSLEYLLTFFWASRGFADGCALSSAQRSVARPARLNGLGLETDVPPSQRHFCRGNSLVAIRLLFPTSDMMTPRM